MKEFNEANFVDVPLDDWTAAALLTAAVPLERVQGATTAAPLPEGLYSLYMGRYSSKLLVQQGKFRYQATEVKHHMHVAALDASPDAMYAGLDAGGLRRAFPSRGAEAGGS